MFSRVLFFIFLVPYSLAVTTQSGDDVTASSLFELAVKFEAISRFANLGCLLSVEVYLTVE